MPWSLCSHTDADSVTHGSRLRSTSSTTFVSNRTRIIRSLSDYVYAFVRRLGSVRRHYRSVPDGSSLQCPTRATKSPVFSVQNQLERLVFGAPIHRLQAPHARLLPSTPALLHRA